MPTTPPSILPLTIAFYIKLNKFSRTHILHSMYFSFTGLTLAWMQSGRETVQGRRGGKCSGGGGVGNVQWLLSEWQIVLREYVCRKICPSGENIWGGRPECADAYAALQVSMFSGYDLSHTQTDSFSPVILSAQLTELMTYIFHVHERTSLVPKKPK